MSDTSKDFQNGFNHGYLLSEHASELAEMIVRTPNDANEYFQGILSGNQQYKMEKVSEKLKSISPDIKEPIEKDKEIEKEK